MIATDVRSVVTRATSDTHSPSEKLTVRIAGEYVWSRLISRDRSKGDQTLTNTSGTPHLCISSRDVIARTQTIRPFL